MRHFASQSYEREGKDVQSYANRYPESPCNQCHLAELRGKRRW